MKVKKWEIALIAAFIITILCAGSVGSVVAQQRELSNKLIRLHVIANSDSDADQALKLRVRDAVTGELEAMLKSSGSRDEAEETLNANLQLISGLCEDTIRREGYDYCVSVTLGVENYPTRVYDTFSLPAGEYLSLKITIGSGEGKNWWCVVFPPVCYTAATKEDLTEMNFSEDEVELITEDSGEQVFKFKILEWLSDIKDFFTRR